jgi:acetoacetyl-CoA synthetase
MTLEVTPLWQPSADRIASAQLTEYTKWLGETRGLDFPEYADLRSWSVRQIEDFWESLWEWFEIDADGSGPALTDRTMPGARWFEGTELSYPEHIFRGKEDSALAIIHASEIRETSEVRWGELRAQVAAVASGLRSLGVESGDRVVAYLPNSLEAVVAFLATASIGAIWSSCSPDFGESSVVDRFAQIEPKVIFAVDGYRYGGKDFDRLEEVERICREMGSLEQVVLCPYLDPTRREESIGGLPTTDWGNLLESGEGSDLRFERVPFSHPLWVLYSSGTTGLPKAIVQGQGGILIEHLKKLHLHSDLKQGDRFFWFTTTGWMMWNFLVSGLLTEATIVLYDGNPGYPDLGRLWDLAAETGVTCFGTSASFIAACMKAEVPLRDGRDLSALDSVGSTGSPLSPEGFRWLYEQLGAELWLFSTSGGSDVCTSFVGAVPTLPVYAGELQDRSLGASVEAWSEDGEPLTDEVGELVVTQPMPSMPLYLWGDPDGSRYRDSYFSMFPGVWRHGDWIEITSRGTAVIYGRSDSTINRQGVRMGTSEIYSAALRIPEITDVLAVDLPREGTEGWLALFVVLGEDRRLDEDLTKRIRDSIRQHCSPRHVPDEVTQIREVPRTLSGKILEVPVKRILMGEDPARAVSRDSLSNPEALDFFIPSSDS